ANERRPSCSASITCWASGLPLATTAVMASSVSLKLSLVNPASAASYCWAFALCAFASNTPATSKPRANTTAMMRSYDDIFNLFPTPAGKVEAAMIAASAFDTIRSQQCASAAALVGLGVPVSALVRHPIADQVLRALELLRPCVAGDEAR